MNTQITTALINIIITLLLTTGACYIVILFIEFLSNKRRYKSKYSSKAQTKTDKQSINPTLIVVITNLIGFLFFIVYLFKDIIGNTNQIPLKTETVISENITHKESETEITSSESYNMDNETNLFNNEPELVEYRITYDISYDELSKNEKDFYDKIISTAMNKDNTFITDKELSFNLNSEISENESIRVQSVFYNNYPDVTIYTTRYSDAWMYHVTHLLNGVPLYRTYYFNVKYKQ